jgi:SagB-type dehydrogenase family enzyme
MMSKYLFLLPLVIFLTSSCAISETEALMDNNLNSASTGSVEPVSQDSGTIQLPEPVLVGNVSLEQTLYKRRSIRDFSDKNLTWDEIGQLLWATQGITDPAGLRTAPSAGARYPLEVYVVTKEGVYHYDPHRHQIRLHFEGDLRRGLHSASLQQDAIIKAPTIFVLSAVYERTQARYGEERTPRYVHMEIGHAGQNLLLQAVALELGSVIIGAFYDDRVKETLSLPADHEPLYLIPVGHPR